MKKYIGFLLVPIMIFEANNNVCYSMEINNSNNISDNNINNYNDLIPQSLPNKYHDLYKKNLKLYVYYKNLISNIPVHDETSFLFKRILGDIKSCCFDLRNYCSIHSRIYANASCKKIENSSIKIVEHDKYRLISTQIIPDSQVKDLLNQYSGDNIQTLEHFEYYYSTQIFEIENNIMKQIIKILTNIDINDDINKNDHENIIEHVKNNIKNLKEQDITDQMKYIIENVIIPALNNLEVLKEQIVQLIDGFSELPMYKTNTNYNEVLSDLEHSLKQYNESKRYIELAIKRFNNEIVDKNKVV